MIRGVILDIDGTLVLSNDEHARAMVAAFVEAGYQVPFERVRPLIGMGTGQLIKSVQPELSEDEGAGKQIKERQSEIFLERFVPDLKAAPGSRDLVQYMLDQGLKLAIGTSAKDQELDTLLKIAGIDDLVKLRTSASDVEHAKPAPDIVKVALDKLDLANDGVMMLGDTPFDIESAARSGVETLAVTCGGWSRDELAGALAVYNDPADLLEHYVDSPLAVTAW